ncbi:MAG: hypothetical protein U5L00_15240 [Desulfovermiculus sp.]|nr:hypothetical protein [Desulfovermiculus sp.]
MPKQVDQAYEHPEQGCNAQINKAKKMPVDFFLKICTIFTGNCPLLLFSGIQSVCNY